MVQVNDLTLRFGKEPLFKNVSIQLSKGNCYGLIGANGAGKSTFLKVLSGDIIPSEGNVFIASDKRMAVLEQNHQAYDHFTPMETVLQGFPRLREVMEAKEILYNKVDFNDEDGIELAELEAEFEEMDGWNAESNAETLLSQLGIAEAMHHGSMKDIEPILKVKVLLAQALFGNPDILLLDEPTNDLDIEATLWLENFLADFENTVVVVSHDRHFLNHVCTHVADIDFQDIRLFVGNYDFWYQSSQLALQQLRDENKKKETKMKELQSFIERFSANASKAKQATSRKKLLEKIELNDIRPSSRKYPFVHFKPIREFGNEILQVKELSFAGEGHLDNFSITLNKEDKIAFVGQAALAKTALFNALMAEDTDPSIKWGLTTVRAYFPKDNEDFFNMDLNCVDWLRQFSEDKSETYIRGFLGRMLFSGEDSLKKVNVLSGGERVRMMLSRMMILGSNVLILDEPTNHLDLESITALNNALMETKNVVLFSSQDHEFIESTANRIVEIFSDGSYVISDTGYDEYLASQKKS